MKKTFCLLILFSVSFISCYEEITDNPIGNKSPETGVFLYPDSTVSSQPSRLKISWWGDDTDGLVIGFYYTWDGINWQFTSSNDSLFALQIGAADTSYIFRVSAVDDGGNGQYDNQVIQNQINYGPEPFTDSNGNGVYDIGENFIDIGLIDPTPAEIKLPIKNSAPQIFWSELSTLPDTSFSVMSFGWEATDLDGDETIVNINVALNDTNNAIRLGGGVRRITIRPFTNSSNPLMEVLIDGNPSNIAPEKLSGLILNGENKIYVQAVDISGAKTPFISLPGEDKSWYVRNPKGNLLVIDDYQSSDGTDAFYNAILDSIGYAGKYDVYDIRNQIPPYINVTFLETIKLFDAILWYTDSNPSLDIAAVSSQKFIDAGGKIFYSMQFQQSVDLTLLQSFLPINPDSSDYRSSVLGTVSITAANTDPSYPDLTTTGGLFRVRSFYPNQIGAEPVYYFSNNELKGYIGFTDSQKNMFFIGVPLHRMNNGDANVKELIEKVLFQDFGLTP